MYWLVIDEPTAGVRWVERPGHPSDETEVMWREIEHQQWEIERLRQWAQRYSLAGGSDPQPPGIFLCALHFNGDLIRWMTSPSPAQRLAVAAIRAELKEAA